MNRRTVLQAISVTTIPVVAGCMGEDGSDGSGDPVVEVHEQWVDPVQLSVDVGATVTWRNEDSTVLPQHTLINQQIHEEATEWDFEATFEETGDEATYTFDEAGLYTYIEENAGEDCMCGGILVGDVSLNEPLPCEPAAGGGNC